MGFELGFVSPDYNISILNDNFWVSLLWKSSLPPNSDLKLKKQELDDDDYHSATIRSQIAALKNKKSSKKQKTDNENNQIVDEQGQQDNWFSNEQEENENEQSILNRKKIEFQDVYRLRGYCSLSATFMSVLRSSYIIAYFAYVLLFLGWLFLIGFT